MRILAFVRVAIWRSVTEMLTPCDTRCTVAVMRSWAIAAVTAAAQLALPSVAAARPVTAARVVALPSVAPARPVSADKDGRQNSLDVITDEGVQADRAKIPHVRKL